MISDQITAIVIDDEENICYLIARILESFKLGIRVIGQANDGSDGLEKFYELLPDIVLIDIKMPGLDGLECLKHMKYHHPEIEVLIISAFDEFEYARSALQEKAFGYILKPIDDEELYKTIKQMKELIVERRKNTRKQWKMTRLLEKLKKGLIAGELPQDMSDADDLQKHNYSIMKAIKYVNSNYHKDISLQSIADEVFLSPTYISELFRKETGYNFTTYLNNLRINKAKELLCLPDLRISEIADIVGYNNSSYFIRIFKKAVGMPPSEYRMRVRKI
jgi:two-component system response regulator YesN